MAKKSSTPTPAPIPPTKPVEAAPETPPVDAAAVESAPVEAAPEILSLPLDLPVVAGKGYAPRSPDLNLRPDEGEALRDLQQGLAAAGETVEGAPVTTSGLAIRWICRQIMAANAARTAAAEPATA